MKKNKEINYQKIIDIKKLIKDDRLKCIAEERKIWRDKLREIVPNLNEIQYFENVDEVKSRI